MRQPGEESCKHDRAYPFDWTLLGPLRGRFFAG